MKYQFAASIGMFIPKPNLAITNYTERPGVVVTRTRCGNEVDISSSVAAARWGLPGWALLGGTPP